MPDVSAANIITDESVVTMTIPVDEQTIQSSEPYQPSEEEKKIAVDNAVNQIVVEVKESDIKLGETIPQATEIIEEKLKHAGGRPCKYCENKEKYLEIAQKYLAWAAEENVQEKRIPFTEELALKMGTHRESLLNWSRENDDHCVKEHAEFIDTIKTLKTIQSFRLQKRTLGRYNPTGAIFLLKTNHNFIESEKKILAGDKMEPLQIEIIEEQK